MRITIDVEEDTLETILELTGESKKSPAIALALKEYVNRKKAKEFGMLLREGFFDYEATNDDIESEDR